MKEILNALLPIKEATGLEIDIYSQLGDLVCTTSKTKPEYRFVYHAAERFTNGLFLDLDNTVTYFLIESPKKMVGVITGANQVSKNYAVMVSKLIETVLSRQSLTYDRLESMRLFLKSQLSTGEISTLKNAFGKKPFNYYVLSLYAAESKINELKDFLNTMSEEEDLVITTDDGALAFFKQCGLEDEYQSASDFATILYDNIKEELRISLKISVGGTIHSFDELLLSYKQAAFAYDYGMLMEPGNSIFSYKEYIMIKMLSEIPSASLKNYLSTLIDKSSHNTLADEELMQTADVFLKNSLNISETSREMYMHRNTLIYRLDKIENATGLNIRHFNDALIFRLITILNRLTSKDKK